jgi:hypothetical protein
MDDFLLGLLGVLFEIFAEVILEVISGMLTSSLEHAGRKLMPTPKYPGRAFTLFLFAVFGISMGLVSVAIFPHPLVHPSRFHGISLLVCPLITGGVMFAAGRLEQRFGRKPTQIETFWIGFVFALAMAITRFLLVR